MRYTHHVVQGRGKLIALFAVVAIASLAAAFFDYQPLWGRVSGFRPWSLGLDLAGGSLLTYEIDLANVGTGERASVVSGIRDVIERRVNLFGVAEPRVLNESVGNRERLIVELAGIRDISQAITEIGETPFLDFREVAEAEGTTTLAFTPTALTGRYVKGAQVGFSTVGGRPQVELEFTGEGATIFEMLTERNVGRPLAIFLDNELIEMPVVQEKISGGRAQITGNYTVEAARQLVARFNAGALPAPITLINQETIAADFGQDALERALLAGAAGTAAIILFMVIVYRGFGVFASLALLIYIALTLALFKIVPVTLTLAGVAGFILSIGMAVDANILVFARTKEEVRKGLARRSAIEEGFKRAWPSIRDSNVSTMITSAVLYYFTSGFVRGFALTLFLGVLMSMFSAITVTRTILRLFVRERAAQ